jgi:hypothetical protein
MAYGSAMQNAYIGPGDGKLNLPKVSPVVDDAWYVRVDNAYSIPCSDEDVARRNASIYRREGHTAQLVHFGKVIEYPHHVVS